MGKMRIRCGLGTTARTKQSLVGTLLLLAGLTTLFPSTALGGFPSISSTTITGISCPTASLCVGVDSVGSIVTSTNPTGGAGAWALARVRHVSFPNGYEGVSCPTADLCVAVDGAGNVSTSTNPTGGASAWSVSHVPGSTEGVFIFRAVSCPSTALCVAVDALGNVITSTNPTGGGSAWTVTPVSETSLNGVSCVAGPLCVLSTPGAGNGIYTSTDPTGGSDAWEHVILGGNPALSSVSCASAALCVVGTRGGEGPVTGIYGSTDPTGGTGTWVEAELGSSVSGLACVSTSFCAGVDFSGRVLTSIEPTGGSSGWDLATIDPPHFLASVSCPSTSLCVAGDSGGNILTSTDPTGGAGAWSLAHVDDAVGETAPEEDGGEEGSTGSDESLHVQPPVPPLAPIAPAPRGVGVASNVALVKGKVALLPLRCGGQGPCRGVAKLFVRVPRGKGQANRKGARRSATRKRGKRLLVIGKGRYAVASGKRGTARIRLTRAGRRLVEKAGRRGLRARLAGPGLRNRAIKVKPKKQKHKRHDRRHGGKRH